MTATALGGLARIPTDELHPSPINPRERLTDIDGLALSMREVGLIQPIIVQRARCTRLGHKKGGSASVGGIACGECWESVIRADERDHLNRVSNDRGRCVLCDVTHDPDANPLSA